ncbi:MAG: ABC transporter substrate-binding protein [Phototrophicaceae bacterium]
MRAKTLLLCLLCLLLAPFTLAISAQDAPITLTFTQWIPADSPRGLLFSEIASEYNALNPNVTVAFDFIPFADYTTTLPLRLSGSNPPDGGWITENVAPTWIASGILTDMGAVLRDDAEFDFADLSPSGMGLWVEGDAVYGIPFSTSPFILIYNRDLFEQAGVDTPDVMIANGDYTWDSLSANLAAVHEATGVVGLQSINGGLYTGERVWQTIVPMVWAYGGDAWDENNVCQLNSAESVAGLQRLHDMIFVDESMEQPGQAVDFYSASAAMLVGQLSRVPDENVTFAWDIAPLPAGPAGTVDVVGQAAFVVFRNSPNSEATVDFLKFLTNKANTLRIAQFFPPIRASVLETDVLVNANPRVSAESMQTAVIGPTLTGRVLPAHPNFPTIDLTSRPYFDQMWSADADIPAIANQLCEAIQPLLSQ